MGTGTVCRMIYPVPGIMTPGRQQASRQVASTFVDSETVEVRSVSESPGLNVKVDYSLSGIH